MQFEVVHRNWIKHQDNNNIIDILDSASTCTRSQTPWYIRSDMELYSLTSTLLVARIEILVCVKHFVILHACVHGVDRWDKHVILFWLMKGLTRAVLCHMRRVLHHMQYNGCSDMHDTKKVIQNRITRFLTFPVMLESHCVPSKRVQKSESLENTYALMHISTVLTTEYTTELTSGTYWACYSTTISQLDMGHFIDQCSSLPVPLLCEAPFSYVHFCILGLMVHKTLNLWQLPLSIAYGLSCGIGNYLNGQCIRLQAIATALHTWCTSYSINILPQDTFIAKV